MGNNDSQTSISLHNWEILETIEGLQILKHKKNQEIAELRTISIDPHFALDDQLQIYQMRQHNNDSLVRAFGAQELQIDDQQSGVCSGHKKVQVLTQRMPYRLCDLPQLTFIQCLLLLRQSLRAYNKVFRSYGPIHVTKKIIGINYLGEVRCWVNQNWALNHPDHDLPTLTSTKIDGIPFERQLSVGSSILDGRYRDETQMIHNIVAIIEQKCEQGYFPQAFSEEIENHSVSFRKLLLYLQDFVQINKLYIPPKISYDKVSIVRGQPPVVGTLEAAMQLNRQENERNVVVANLQNIQKERQFNQRLVDGQSNIANANIPTIRANSTYMNLHQKIPNETQLHIDLPKPINTWNRINNLPLPVENQSSYSSKFYGLTSSNPSIFDKYANPSYFNSSSLGGFLTNQLPTRIQNKPSQTTLAYTLHNTSQKSNLGIHQNRFIGNQTNQPISSNYYNLGNSHTLYGVYNFSVGSKNQEEFKKDLTKVPEINFNYKKNQVWTQRDSGYGNEIKNQLYSTQYARHIPNTPSYPYNISQDQNSISAIETKYTDPFGNLIDKLSTYQARHRFQENPIIYEKNQFNAQFAYQGQRKPQFLSSIRPQHS